MDDLTRRLEADNSDVGRLLKAFFLPKKYGDNFRLASEGAGVSSATGNLSQMIDVGDDWSAATTAAQISQTDMMCFLFANTLRSCVFFVHNAAGANYQYDAYPITDPTSTSFACTAGMTVQSYFLNALASGATPAPAIRPHGDVLYPGYDDAGNTYLWVDNSPLGGSTASMSVALVPPSTTVDGSITWYYWNGKSATPWETQTFLAVPHLYVPTTLPPGGAYMFVRVANVADPTMNSFTVSVRGNRGCWAHRPIPDIQTLTGQDPVSYMAYVNGIRVNAAAFKAQNNSQELDKNGNLISVTVASGIPWSNIATGTASLSNLQNYRERINANGYYGVLLPDSDEDISDFFDDIAPWYMGNTPAANGPVQTSFPLAERRPYKALGISAPLASGRQFSFDITHCIEYLTNWRLQSRDNPRTSEESLIAAIVIASTMETDYENPSHWQDILASIGKYGSRIVGYQIESPVLDTISKFHPALTLARQIGKNVVLPLQQKGFQMLEDWANKQRKKTRR